MALLSVSAHDIDIAGRPVEIDLPLDWLAEELDLAPLTAVAPGHFQGRLSRSGSGIVVRGRVSVDLQIPCARCLDPAKVHVDTELSLLLKPVAAAGALPHAHAGKKAENGSRAASHREPEYEFSADEAEIDTYDGESVVLDPFLREAILLEIPNFPLCSEACPGIGRAAEEPAPEPAIDPRLAPLGALREKIARKRPASRPPQRSPKLPRAPKKKNKE